MSYSNVTKAEIEKILKANRTHENVTLLHIQKRAMYCGRCLYAEDTGALAIPNRPCRGNKIICHKIDGHTSYAAACKPEKCRFYEVGDVDETTRIGE